MNIYMIYAPFLLLCVFCLCLSVFADFIFTSSSTCNWKMLRGHVAERSLQRRPKMTQQRQGMRPKKYTKTLRWRSIRTGPDRSHHGLPVVGGARPCVPWAARVFPFSRDFSFSCVFFCYFAFIIWCIWTFFPIPNSLPSTLLSSPLALE